MSRQAITKWEADKGMPDIENLKQLSKLLNISIDYLLLDEISESDSEITALISEVKSKGDVQYRKFVNIMKALTLVADKI